MVLRSLTYRNMRFIRLPSFLGMVRARALDCLSKFYKSCISINFKSCIQTRGVSRCDIPIYIKKYLKAKEELSKLKYFTMLNYNLPKIP